jgi:TPR repeat protein
MVRAGESVVLLPQQQGEVQRDLLRALQNYGVASRKGNILALHRISVAVAHGPPIAKQLVPQVAGQSVCQTAVSGFKAIAEADVIGADHSPFSSRKVIALTDALDALENDGDEALALTIFSELASLGLESAQSNAASLLAREGIVKGHVVASTSVEESIYVVHPSDAPVSEESKALHLYSLSSAQGNVEAFLQMGDIHYYGKAGLAADKRQAVVNYQAGADMHHPHALFNLGLMYATGDGVTQVHVQ